eukprot:gene10485-14088_t
MDPSKYISLSKRTYTNLMVLKQSELSQYDEMFIQLPKPLTAESQMKALKFIHFVRLYNMKYESTTNQTIADSPHLNKMNKKAIKLQSILMRSNLRLVYSIALSYQGMGVELSDLVYEGVKGLRKSLLLFDVNKGFAFSTYAYPWIKDYIRAALARSLPIDLPRHVHRLLVKVKLINRKLFYELQRNPTEEELQTALGLSTERFDIVRRALALASRSSSSDTLTTNNVRFGNTMFFDESTWEEIISDQDGGFVINHVESKQPEPSTISQKNDVRDAIFAVLGTLPIHEAAAIYIKLGLYELQGESNTNTVLFDDFKQIADFEIALNEVKKQTKEEFRILYHKGLRKLRRRLNKSNISKLFENLNENVELLNAV